ncbi:hypothetical protein [Phenylobacterium sp.]|uniref:hypothetical protein n=1 Tax=Phenylobacterium sp. TaxID=1871053 RepID=UPI0025D32EBA|nr:hypothetical protein [Phenylobacterium sp.]MBX3483470.1 hypothetical protein [Phenylobacterium sp.]MCW5758925.1 hypothetical protein [Phenylobacterium sp.]
MDMPTDMPTNRAPESAPDSMGDMIAAMSPLDAAEALDLHRAINERRASVENAEKLRHLRSL